MPRIGAAFARGWGMDGIRGSELLAIAWFAAAAAVALGRPLAPHRRRRILLGAATGGAIVLATSRLAGEGVGGVFRTLLPSTFVVAAYWVSGAFFVAPQLGLEQRLLAADRRLLGPLGLEDRLAHGPRWIVEAVEASYLAVYLLLPLGAWAAWSAGGNVAVDRFWTTVFLAEASSYLPLAWIQTRPPWALEPWTGAVRARSVFGRINELVLRHGSNQINTIPSGHAAGAVAVALSLASLDLALAAPFIAVAAAILVATVVGRYHFALDTVAGALVALVAWAAVGLWASRS